MQTQTRKLLKSMRSADQDILSRENHPDVDKTNVDKNSILNQEREDFI